jgi:hypothetical protein
VKLISVELLRRFLILFFCVSPALSGFANAQERNRWELITAGSSNVGDPGATAGTVPNLTGTDANFLFRLDNMIKPPVKQNGKLDMHVVFDIGVLNPARAVTTRTDPATSQAAVALNVTPTAATTVTGTSISHERAFTTGGQFNLNWLPKGAQNDAYSAELGAVFKGHFDAYFDNERFYERDGVTYVKLDTGSTAESGFFRGETGLRLRITQKADNSRNANTGLEKQDNIDDLLLIEGLVQRASALKALSSQYNVNASNRYVFRFMAFPGVNPMDLSKVKNTKFVIGMEVSNDLHNRGKKDIQLFFGLNANLGKLF